MTPQTSKQEDALIDTLYPNVRGLMITRRSARSYDLTIEGFYGYGHAMQRSGFSAWLPLGALHALEAKDYARAVRMSDYPQMAGDWSGIRDSAPETIWRMFDVLVVRRQSTRRTHA